MNRVTNSFGKIFQRRLEVFSRKRYFSVGTSEQSISQILQQMQSGSITAETAENLIVQQQNERKKSVSGKAPDDVLSSFANLDHSRAQRTRFPEAVFSQGKTPKQIAIILDDMADHVNNLISNAHQTEIEAFHKAILATRVDKSLYEEIIKYPLKNGTITYHEVAKIISVKASALEGQSNEMKKIGKVAVTCAGTTDLPVAEEAAITLEAAGCEVDRIYDVGVAGLHRIINALPRLKDPSVDCVICIAGMHHFEFVKYLFGIDNISNHFLKAWKGRCRQC
jgi:NCAIR mutase (PurE)-related protein